MAINTGCIPVDISGPPDPPTYFANLSPPSVTLRPGQPGRFLFSATASDRQGNTLLDFNQLEWRIENAPTYAVGNISTPPSTGVTLAITGDYLSPASLPEGVSRVTFTIRARYGPMGTMGNNTFIEATSQVTLDVNAPVSPEQVP
jgi:hypothetical protein